MSLSFCRLRIFAFDVGERHVRRFVPEPDSEDQLTSEFADHPGVKCRQGRSAILIGKTG